MSKVYVVQKQLKRSPSGEMVSAFDLSPAEEYGELVYVVSEDALPFRPASIIRQMHEVLANFSEADYLLLIGNPCLIGWATTIAAMYTGGRIRQLQWSGRSRSYIPVEAKIFPLARSGE